MGVSPYVPLLIEDRSFRFHCRLETRGDRACLMSRRWRHDGARGREGAEGQLLASLRLDRQGMTTASDPEAKIPTSAAYRF